MDAKILSVDIGGSSVKSGVFSRTHFSPEQPLVKNFEAIAIAGRKFTDVQTAVEAAIEIGLHECDRVTSVGISTTGSVGRDGVVKSAGHFDGYEMVDWSEILRARFPSLPSVTVENDGKASAWAEYSHFGDGNSSHVHFVVGTGVGSSMVVSGQLIHGDTGDAGFLGHTRVTNGDTITCSCDRQGCLETVASGPGIVHEYNKAAGTKIQDFEAFRARLAAGDSAAKEVLDAACVAFGRVSAVVINGVNPKSISFGGGVMLGLRAALREQSDEGYFLERIHSEIAKIAFTRSAAAATLHYGVFHNDGGLVGAGLLAK